MGFKDLNYDFWKSILCGTQSIPSAYFHEFVAVLISLMMGAVPLGRTVSCIIITEIAAFDDKY